MKKTYNKLIRDRILEDLEHLRAEKCEQLGGFKKRLFLEWVLVPYLITGLQ